MSTSEPTAATPTAATPTVSDITITELAVTKVREVLAQQGLGEDESFLRVYVAGQSCSGPAFGLAFDEAHEDDATLELSGLGVVIDPVSLPYVQGASIDFVETEEVTGFKVSVPNSGASCASSSCGTTPEAGGCPPSCG
jgi:iron-sulfur cluster assembly accessory protein